MKGEVIKQIEGHPDYLISNKGRVYSLKSNRWLNPSCSVGNRYYHRVCVRKNGKNFLLYVHILVGKHFLSNYTPDMCILHRDETLSYPQIHFVENLWVGSHADNMQDMMRKGRGRSGMKNRRHTAETKRKIGESMRRNRMIREMQESICIDDKGLYMEYLVL